MSIMRKNPRAVHVTTIPPSKLNLRRVKPRSKMLIKS